MVTWNIGRPFSITPQTIFQLCIFSYQDSKMGPLYLQAFQQQGLT